MKKILTITFAALITAMLVIGCDDVHDPAVSDFNNLAASDNSLSANLLKVNNDLIVTTPYDVNIGKPSKIWIPPKDYCWGDRILDGSDLRYNPDQFLYDLNRVKKCRVITGDLRLINMPEKYLYMYQAFDNLTSVWGNMYIEANELADLSGLSNLSYVGGNLIVHNNPNIDYIELDGLTTIGGFFQIKGNNELYSLYGIRNVALIKGDLNIENNEDLPTKEAEKFAYSSERTIEGNITISNNNEE